MLRLHHRRVQLSVGQGGFHYGYLDGDNDAVDPWPRRVDPSPSALLYVYDCGAMRRYAAARDREIARFLGKFRGQTLDFLFISHFHADHVNGLPDLLHVGRGIKVDTIVMPVIDEIERLAFYARSLEEGGALSRETFYRNFILDPVKALSSYHPRRIILVRRSPPDARPDFDGDPLIPGGGDLPSVEPVEGQKVFGWKVVGRGRVDRVVDPAAAGAGTEIYKMDDTVGIRLSTPDDPAWLMIPYVDPDFRRRHDFLAQLTLRVPNARALAQTVAGRSSLVRDHWRQMRAAFAVVQEDLNLSSMSLYSGPIIPPADRWRWPYAWGCQPGVGCHRLGWLATGDADLATNNRRAAFLAHYQSQLDEVGTLVIPHHGSEKNFHPQLISGVEPISCVVAADAYKTWRHPATSVVQTVASAGIPLRVATSDSRSQLIDVWWA